MSHITLFFTEIILSVVLSLLISALISRPLANNLKKSCEAEQQASFWVAYTKMMLFIFPILIVLLISVFNHSVGLEHIKISLIGSLGGLLLALLFIGRKLYFKSTNAVVS
ncbi:MAG TPA: hypothetical protein EYG68_05155 [Leucothrix mucor]|nr:hypothetical protein [Leucothrix mucor]